MPVRAFGVLRYRIDFKHFFGEYYEILFNDYDSVYLVFGWINHKLDFYAKKFPRYSC